MKTWTTHRGTLTGTGRESASVVMVSLVLIAVLIATCYQIFGQSGTSQSSFSAPQTVEALTGPDKNAATPSSRRVFVRSKSLLVRAAVVEDKLLKRQEFKQLGFVITRDEPDADLILELRHDLLTKYVFSVVDVKTQTLLASGKVSSLGGTVAGKVAKRFVRDMARTRTP